jgi:alpha-glucosidase
MLALPGSAYLYQGEELGLPEHTTLPDELRQDPTWFRHGGTIAGRDGCRVPMPWLRHAPAYGFSPTGETWLPQPDSFASYAVDAQSGVAASTLELYRAALRLRRELGLGLGKLEFVDSYGNDVLAFRRDAPGGTVLVLATVGPQSLVLPVGAPVLLATVDVSGGRLPEDATAWLAV